jgi:hypothetical protein
LTFLRHCQEDTIPILIDTSKHVQETLEEQMFHNRRTLQEITKLRRDNIEDNVISFYLLKSFFKLNLLKLD